MMKAWNKRDHKRLFLKLSSRLIWKHYLMKFNLIFNAMKRKKKKKKLTLVTTDKMATEFRISCHAPMFRALDATGRLNWVVNFQASTLISKMLLNRAKRGAKGKEATKRVMKPNWITGITGKAVRTS